MLKIKIRGLKEELDGRSVFTYESRIWFHGWKAEHGKQETSKTTKQDQMKISVYQQRDFIFSLKISKNLTKITVSNSFT